MYQNFVSFWNIYFVLCAVSVDALSVSRSTTEDPKSWTGKWFPEEPSSLTNETQVNSTDDKRFSDTGPMGVINSKCDDGKINLSIDWDGSFADYICLDPRNRFVPDPNVNAKLEFENIPKMYKAVHYCMHKSIEYNSELPTYGPHRPLWGRYGEYKYLPKQRWLHNLEHGGIAALYHPCADFQQILLFKELVSNCLRRHVISPTSALSPDRPFALLAWGVRFTMSVVVPDEVEDFIIKYGVKGPEHVPADGQFDFLLVKPAEIVSDFEDSTLCPK